MLSKIFGNWDWRHWMLTHLVWMVAIGAALLFGHIALQNHDARLAAEAAVKVSEATVANLKQQIASTDAAASAQKQTVVKIVQAAQTPAQVVPAIPQLTDVPLNARTIPNNPVDVEVAAVPLIQLLGEFKQATIDLAACQSDFKNEKVIETQKDQQIAILTKKPRFLHKVGSTMKAVGIGVGIGLLLAAHGL